MFLSVLFPFDSGFHYYYVTTPPSWFESWSASRMKPSVVKICVWIWQFNLMHTGSSTLSIVYPLFISDSLAEVQAKSQGNWFGR